MDTHVQRFSIRQTTIQDAAELSAFAERVFVETFADGNTIDDMTAYARSTFSLEHQLREIADPGAFLLLAYASDGDLAGYSHVMSEPLPSEVADPTPDITTVEIRRFYVAKEWQGAGLARQLMDESKHHAAARGARRVWLGVWEHNPRAIAFYRKQGFETIGTHPFLLGGDLQTDLVMAMSLEQIPASARSR
jgi:diamine N-acetyltransferase